MAEKVVIDIEARFTDNTKGVDAAQKKLDKLSASAKKLNGIKGTKIRVAAEDNVFAKKMAKAEQRAKKFGHSSAETKLGVRDRASAFIEKAKDKAMAFARGSYNAFLTVRDSGALKTIGQIGGGLKSLTGKAWNVSVGIIDKATAPARAITGKLNSALGLAGAGLSTYGMVVKPIQLEADYQDLTSQFEVLLGSRDAAQKRITQLTDFAGQTPFTRDQIYQASRVLEVYSPAISTPDAPGGLRMVGDIAAGTGAEYNEVALWVGRLYSALEGGRPVGEMTAALQEMGAIGGVARNKLETLAESGKSIGQIWPQVTAELSRFDGTMAKQSDNLNNLLLGVKSFATNNFLKKIGSGLSESLTPFLKKFRQWRSENSELIAEWASGVEKFAAAVSGKALSSLEALASRFQTAFKSEEFQQADSLFGKGKVVWDAVIGEPFSDWWNGSGKARVVEMANSFGETLGKGISSGIMALFGVKTDVLGEGMDVGRSFLDGFKQGFDGSEVASSIWTGMKTFFKAHPMISLLLGGAGTAKLIGGIGSGLAAAGSGNTAGLSGLAGTVGNIKTLYDSLKSITGSAAAGKLGSSVAGNLIGTAASIGGARVATGGLAKGATLSAGLASGLGLAALGGGIASGATVLSGSHDLYKAVTADNAYDRKYHAVKSGSKFGGAGIGAAIGTAILPGMGTLIGAGIGGIAGWLTSGKLADHFVGTADAAKKYGMESSEAARRTEELKEKQEALAKDSLEQHFGKVTLNADEMSTAIKNVLGTGRMEAIDQTTAAITQMKNAYTSLQESEAALKKTTWMAGMKNGSKMAAEEVEGLKAATKSYSDSAKQYLSDSQYAATQSVQLLMGNSKASKSLVESTNQYYGETESKLGKLNSKLKTVMDEALSDGKINMDVEMPKIEEIRSKITELTSKLAKEDFQADLNILKAKSGAGDLSVESFGQLMTGSQEAAEKAAQGYWDAFGQASIGKSDKEIKTLQKGLYNQLSDLQLDVGNLGLDTMRNQYSKELGFLGDDIGSMLQEHTGPEIYNAVQSMSETNRAAIGQFVEQLAPTTEQIQSLADNYKALGAEVPAAITEYLNSASFYEALSQGPQSINSWLQNQEFEGNPTVKMNPNVEMADLNGDGVISQMEAALSGQTLTPELLANPSIITQGADGSGVLSQLEADMSGQTISPAVSVNPIATMASGSSTPFADLTSKIQGSLAGQTVRPNVGVKPIYNLAGKFNPQESGAVNPSYHANTNVAVNAKYNPNKYNVYQGINRSYSASTTVNVAVKYNAIPGSFNPPKPDGAFRGGIFGGGSIRGYSDGGIVAGGGQLIQVAEEGTPEMVIPLSRKRKQRGMELWEKAGRYLGVQGYARGGVAGSEEPISIPATSGDSGGVNLHVGGINLTVPVKSGANVVQAVEENLSKISDQVAGELLAAIRSQYANLPVTG